MISVFENVPGVPVLHAADQWLTWQLLEALVKLLEQSGTIQKSEAQLPGAVKACAQKP